MEANIYHDPLCEDVFAGESEILIKCKREYLYILSECYQYKAYKQGCYADSSISNRELEFWR